MMPSLLETRSQPDVFFSNSSLYKTSPDLAVGRTGVFAEEQEERKMLKSKKKKVRERIDFMARFYQICIALSRFDYGLQRTFSPPLSAIGLGEILIQNKLRLIAAKVARTDELRKRQIALILFQIQHTQMQMCRSIFRVQFKGLLQDALRLGIAVNEQQQPAKQNVGSRVIVYW